MRYLLDTTVVIEYVIGDPSADRVVRRCFEETGDVWVCDVVTCEALSGGTDAERAAIVRFLGPIEFVALSPADAQRAGDLRRAAGGTSPRTLGDALIAALALANDATIVSRNASDFLPMGAKVLQY
jgi:predicted nucleic acid-binding protein